MKARPQRLLEVGHALEYALLVIFSEDAEDEAAAPRVEKEGEGLEGVALQQGNESVLRYEQISVSQYL